MLRKFRFKILTLLIMIFAVLKFVCFLFQADVWWDSAVYIGMGKYIFSNGQFGLWEPIRPLTLPIILGFFWKIGLNPLIAGEIFILLVSVGVIILTYALSNKLFDKNTAVAASILVAFSSLMLSLRYSIQVETLTVFFMLLGFYFYLEKKNFVSGALFGLAFLTKFPAALFLAVVFVIDTSYLFFSKEKFLAYFKKFFYIGLGFILIIFPYFLFNYISYNDALFPLKSAQYVIDNVVGCNVLYRQPFYYYIPLIIKDNFLFLFSVIGIAFAFFDKNKLNKIHNKKQHKRENIRTKLDRLSRIHKLLLRRIKQRRNGQNNKSNKNKPIIFKKRLRKTALQRKSI